MSRIVDKLKFKLDLKSDAFKILFLFLIWKAILMLTLFYGIKYIPLGHTDRFLGGGPINFNIAPELFSWANFDGEHYLAISIFGYKPLEQAFFPVYPLLINILTKPFNSYLFLTLVNSTIVGLLISNISFFLALLILYKLIIIDYSNKIAFLTIIMMLIFPTSFFFGALYNESLFLLLSLLAYFCVRKKKWAFASLFGFIASATRVFGVFLFLAFLVEVIIQKEKFVRWFWILFIPFGLIFYMIYQYLTVGDFFAFYNLQTIVGEQHQLGIVALPQVYFRYIKILLSFDSANPLYQTIFLEFSAGVIFFILPILGFLKKVRLSYIFYALIVFLVPTFQGSFSSLPRYVLIIFPSFLVLSLLVNKLSLFTKFFLIIFSVFCLIIESLMFLRGYWVA